MAVGCGSGCGTADRYTPADSACACCAVGKWGSGIGGENGAGGGDTLSDKQIETMQRLIQESGCNIELFLKLANAPSVSDIRATKFAEAVGWLERKIAAKRGAP